MNAITGKLSSPSRGVKLSVAAACSLALTWLAFPANAQTSGASIADDSRFADAFNSFSIGIGGGFDSFSAPATATSSDFFPGQSSPDLSPTFVGQGGFGTAEFGKDFRVGSFVMGLYGDYAWGGKSDSFSDSVRAETSGENCAVYQSTGWGCFDTLTTAGSLELKNSYSVIGRLGVLVNPRTLIYGLLGYTQQEYAAQFSAMTSDPFRENPPETATASRSGWTGSATFGLGAEMLVTPNFSIKGEFRYVHFGGISNLGATTLFSVPHTTGYVSVNGGIGAIDDGIVRVVATYKFH